MKSRKRRYFLTETEIVTRLIEIVEWRQKAIENEPDLGYSEDEITQTSTFSVHTEDVITNICPTKAVPTN